MEGTKFDEIPAPSAFAEATGRGVRIAVIDSGINFDHPHLRCRGSGFGVEWRDTELEATEGFADRFGHGTCCAALIHLLAPDAALVAVRVTAERATTDADRLARGIEWAAERAEIICVPAATRTLLPHGLIAAVEAAATRSALVVAADPGGEAYPAACEGAVGVQIEDGVDVARRGKQVFADGRARPAAGHNKNFYGPSLSAARVSAFVARAVEASGLPPREAWDREWPRLLEI